MSKSSIVTTKNYRLFVSTTENRPLNLKKRKRLRESMREYGFLKSFPLSCSRNGHSKLVVKDGQHRLAVAEELGLAVHYFVEDVDYDIAKVNCTQEKWQARDFAMKHAACGKTAYQEGLEFADAHNLPIGTAFGLLAGTVSWTNIKNAFIGGTFAIKDRPYADEVASTYCALVDLSPELRNSRLLEACMYICRVKDFDAGRLIAGARRCRDKLVSYSTRDAYLDMLQDLYNFGRKNLVPLKIQATQTMRDRGAVKKK